ncbi:MAG: cupin domain-containing protein [Nocardioides sp.]
MTDRILAADLLTSVLPHQSLPREDIVEGAPTAGFVELGRLGGAEVGVWEMTEGTATDTEADEIFIVLSGHGAVAFADGSSIDVGPGSVVRLHAGERTVWTITKRLRKVYVAVT